MVLNYSFKVCSIKHNKRYCEQLGRKLAIIYVIDYKKPIMKKNNSLIFDLS